MPENTSKKYSLNHTDLTKIGVGALVTSAGALLAFLATVATEIDYTVVVGGATLDFTAPAIVFFGAVIEAGRRFLTDYSAQ